MNLQLFLLDGLNHSAYLQILVLVRVDPNRGSTSTELYALRRLRGSRRITPLRCQPLAITRNNSSLASHGQILPKQIFVQRQEAVTIALRLLPLLESLLLGKLSDPILLLLLYSFFDDGTFKFELLQRHLQCHPIVHPSEEDQL